MKNLFSVSAMLVFAIMIMASCTPVQRSSDEYYDRYASAPQRIYVDDPYQGTVVLERDPVTGRYYQVHPSPYGYGRYNSWDRRYGNRYNDRYYNRPRGQQPPPQPPTEQQIKEREKNRQDARRKVLGG